MPFGKKEWYKTERLKGTIPDIFRHPAITSHTPQARSFSDPGIRIKLNGIDFDVPENGTPGGITPPKFRQLQQQVQEVQPPPVADHPPVVMDTTGEANKLQREGITNKADATIPQLDVAASSESEVGPSKQNGFEVVNGATCHDILVEPTCGDRPASSPGLRGDTLTETDGDVKLTTSTVEDKDDSTVVDPENRPIRGIKLVEDGDEDEPRPKALGKAEDGSEHHVVEQAKKKKKSGSRKGGSGKGPTALNKIRGTGFEAGFADPPMTLEEFEEEKLIYDPESPFVDRIEECIQRYRGRRRLDATRDIFFSRYLNMGGIDTSQRQFTGYSSISKDDIAGLSKSEKRMAAANDVINRKGDDPRWFTPGDQGWTIDFAGVAAAYLSIRLPVDVGGDQDMIQLGIDTILNFINYVIKHNVCPEYEADLARARGVCKMAKMEFPMISNALASGMGQFNYACRTIFNLPDETDAWVDRMSIDPAKDRIIRPSLVFASTLALLADMYPQGKAIDLYKLRDQDPALDKIAAVVAVESETKHYEVVDLREPDDSIARLFRALHNGDKITGHYRPAGILVVRRCIVEDGFANTPKLHTSPQKGPTEDMSFIVDRDLLRTLLPGMRLQLETAKIKHPDFEITFIKNLLDVQPSFRLFLPQMLMLDYKQPRENPRDPPSVDHPDAEGECDGHLED